MSRILIIEDDDQVREVLKDMLERLNYDVITAADGEEGFKKAAEFETDIILLDITLPGINGYEICRSFKANTETRLIPVVMITAMTEKKERIKGIRSGADDFLTKPFDRQELFVRIRSLIKVKNLNEEMESVDNILSVLISIIDAKDSYTRNHSDRVKNLSMRIAEKLSFPSDRLLILEKAADLHDIGKIGVSDLILNKQGLLNDEEFESVKQHSCIGERLCSPLKALKPILKIIRHHHERYDGGGYPDGVNGEDIPIEARVIALADSYDAMASDRPYRGKLSAEKILSELNAGKGTQWDEKAVNCLIDLLNDGQIY